MMHERVGKEQVWKTSDGQVTEKDSEVAGTWDMPTQAAPSKVMPGEKAKPLSTIPKVGSLINTFGWEEKMASAQQPSIDDELEMMFKTAADDTREKQGDEPDTNLAAEHKDQPASLPQNTKVLVPHVDVTSQEPPKVVAEKTAQYYAMPSMCRYPLDGFHQVKKASAYFDDYWKEMEPEDRREFAKHLVKRASVLGLPVSGTAEHYGASSYAPRIHTLTELAAREDLVKTAEHQSLYDELKEQLGVLHPEVFAQTLHEIDKFAGIDESYGRDCMDPWYTTFGVKTAEPVSEGSTVGPSDAVIIGNEYMKIPDLVEFAKAKQTQVIARYGEDFAKGLADDPAGIFDTLPRDQKIIMMRMVNNSHSTTQGASTS